MDAEFVDRLDAELLVLKARITEHENCVQTSEQRRELHELRARLETLQHTRRLIEEQSHGS